MKLFILFTFFISVDSLSMIRALNTAATGMASQEIHVNTISNNIANVNTTAYKKQRAETEDLLYQTYVESGARSSQNTKYNVGVQVGTGSKVSAIRKEFVQGSPKITNNPYDLMIQGDGFFGVELPNGLISYTRDGSFNVNAQGQLTTKDGYKLIPTITLPPNILTLNISNSGNVDAFIQNQQEPVNLGQIPVFMFTNPVGLKSTGRNLYQGTLASGSPIQSIAGENGAGGVQQGSLESSNVSIMNEMTSLIRAQRAYEMNSKVMSVADQMLQTVNNIR